MKKQWFTELLVSAVLLSSAAPLTAAAAELKVNANQSVADVNVTTTPSVVAQDDMKDVKITKDEAIAIAKKVGKVTDDYKLEGVNSYSNWMGGARVWQVNFGKNEKFYSNINVSINADTGVVMSLNIFQNDPSEQAVFPPKVSYDKAVEIAKAYTNDVLPGKIANMQVDEEWKANFEKLPYRDRTSYNIRFIQKINNLPFYENSLFVNVSGNGKVTNFGYNWNDNLQFDTTEGVLSAEQARKIQADSTEMELRYTVDYYNPQNFKNARLIYVPKQNNLNYSMYGMDALLDAKTGKYVDYTGKPVGQQEFVLPTTPIASTAVPLPTRTKDLTEAEAYKVVTDRFTIPSGLKLDSSQYSENYGPYANSVWSFNWRSESTTNPYYLYAEVNAKTGELINFSNERVYMENSASTDVNVKVTKAEAVKAATEFVKKAAADKADRLYVTMPVESNIGKDQKPRTYEIYFVRKENGIVVQGQGINVTISSETGEVVRYYQEFRDVAFPSINSVIPVEKAKETYLKDTKQTLQYFIFRPTGNENNTKATLVYGPTIGNYNKYLDAQDGKWHDLETGKVVGEDTVATDIKGHKYEKELQAMIDYNIFSIDGGKVSPDKVVSKGEFVEFLMKAIGDYGVWYNESSPLPFADVKKDAGYYPYLQRAIERSFVKKDGEQFKPGAAIYREDIAVLLTRALGYDKLASKTNLFDFNYKDKKNFKSPGHIGLVTELGLMGAYNTKNEFQPYKGVTRADVAVILYRFMEKNAELRELPYYY